MVSLLSLWPPILVAAVLVFVASSVIHMALGYHAGDWRKLPDEDGVQEALRRFGVGPGDYQLPKPESAAALKEPAFVARRDQGPVLVMTVFPPGATYGMGKQLATWFLYALIVGVFAGYVAAIVLPASGCVRSHASNSATAFGEKPFARSFVDAFISLASSSSSEALVNAMPTVTSSVRLGGCSRLNPPTMSPPDCSFSSLISKSTNFLSCASPVSGICR